MLLGLILGSMVSGLFFAMGLVALFVTYDTIKETISSYNTYRRNKSYGNEQSLSDYRRYDPKGIFVSLAGALACLAIGSLILWASYDYTQDYVLCDFKGGTLNDSNQCVQEIKL